VIAIINDVLLDLTHHHIAVRIGSPMEFVAVILNFGAVFDERSLFAMATSIWRMAN
jgi:hypothetical protein